MFERGDMEEAAGQTGENRLDEREILDDDFDSRISGSGFHEAGAGAYFIQGGRS